MTRKHKGSVLDVEIGVLLPKRRQVGRVGLLLLLLACPDSFGGWYSELGFQVLESSIPVFPNHLIQLAALGI